MLFSLKRILQAYLYLSHIRLRTAYGAERLMRRDRI